MTDRIEYAGLMHKAMRGLVRDLLADISETGLPGEHHFFVTFKSDHPGVQIADWLKESYPEEMTIVIQNWFENLEVEDEKFGITLNFGDNPEHLVIPYDAITTFVDPSVEFGLRFDASDEDIQAVPEPEELEAPMLEIEEVEDHQADVVSLDSFRKN